MDQTLGHAGPINSEIDISRLENCLAPRSAHEFSNVREVGISTCGSPENLLGNRIATDPCRIVERPQDHVGGALVVLDIGRFQTVVDGCLDGRAQPSAKGDPFCSERKRRRQTAPVGESSACYDGDGQLVDGNGDQD